jgi:Cu/Ag efflux protein CusF
MLGTMVILIALPGAVLAQKPVTQNQTGSLKATIDSIDHDSRMITLKYKDGDYETVYAGPEVKRFDELKVGDKVTFRATESVVFEIRKPGESVPPSSADEPVIARNAGPRPGGTLTQKATATVTVKAIDMKAPSVTVKTEDGRTISFKVDEKKRLKDVNVGDRVVINYTVSLLISVE